MMVLATVLERAVLSHAPAACSCYRRSQALRLSLSDAFAGQSDQHRGQQQSDSDRCMLSEAECNAMFEMCLKLSTENKINDRNVWSLEFITHLPDIVRTSKANFQKMSGGLEAGVCTSAAPQAILCISSGSSGQDSPTCSPYASNCRRPVSACSSMHQQRTMQPQTL